MRAWLLSAVLIAAGGVALLDCKGSAVCGDGNREEPEQCDNGLSNGAVGNNCSADCTLVGISRALLRVTVYRLRDEAPGYPGATCKDLGAAKVRLVVSGPDAKDEQYDCQSSLPAYDGITPGMYQVSATLLDDKGIDGELKLREWRTGRVETTQMWGRPESVRQEFRRIRQQ